MQGLQLLVRLMRHHPETVHSQLHSVIVAVAKQVRNLRSQVARAACQASGELFLSQKKAAETVSDHAYVKWRRLCRAGGEKRAVVADEACYFRRSSLRECTM